MLNKRSKIFVVTFLACSYELPSNGLVLNHTLKGGLLAKPLQFRSGDRSRSGEAWSGCHFVTRLNFTVHNIWDSSTLGYGNEELSIWPVENEVIVSHGHVHTVLHPMETFPSGIALSQCGNYM
jgi:hypothetical protein